MRRAMVRRRGRSKGSQQRNLTWEFPDGAMDDIPEPILPARPEGHYSGGASRIGVDTNRNHFIYATVGDYIPHVSEGGLFGNCICPLVPTAGSIEPVFICNQLVFVCNWPATGLFSSVMGLQQARSGL